MILLDDAKFDKKVIKAKNWRHVVDGKVVINFPHFSMACVAILSREDAGYRTLGWPKNPPIFQLLVPRHEYEQKREKEGKDFFYYRSSALSLLLPTLMFLLALQFSRWEGSLPVVDAQSLLCRLGSLRPRSSGNVLALPWYKLSWWHSTNILPVYVPESEECLCPVRLWRVSSPDLLPSVSLSIVNMRFHLWYHSKYIR